MLRLLLLSSLVVFTFALPNVRYQRQIDVQQPNSNQLGEGENAQEDGATIDGRFGGYNHGHHGHHGHHGGGGYRQPYGDLKLNL